MNSGLHFALRSLATAGQSGCQWHYEIIVFSSLHEQIHCDSYLLKAVCTLTQAHTIWHMHIMTLIFSLHVCVKRYCQTRIWHTHRGQRRNISKIYLSVSTVAGIDGKAYCESSRFQLDSDAVSSLIDQTPSSDSLLLLFHHRDRKER